MFTSGAEYYTRNLKASQNFTAIPARIHNPAGGRENGIVLLNGKGIGAVMPVSEALRLANQIADALAAHRAKA